LKTQQVARALGMSVSTIKRWVDAGVLRAGRTVGKHRLISAAEALRFARERGLPTADLEILAGVGASHVGTIDDRSRDALVAALGQGRAEEARALILTAHASAGGAVVLADELIGPVMERVGHDWEAGALDVFGEHRATRIIESVLMELNRKAPGPPGATGPLALGATPEGDLYTLAGLLCELTLRESGWEAQDLGPNLPLASLARAVRTHRPRLVWLSIHHLGDPERFLQEYAAFDRSASATRATVILGGPALGPALRARLMAAAFGDRMVHLAEFARRLHPAGGEATDHPGSMHV
jgi:MerR family transcriptional regulator, light-induced transcriptional regulator